MKIMTILRHEAHTVNDVVCNDIGNTNITPQEKKKKK